MARVQGSGSFPSLSAHLHVLALAAHARSCSRLALSLLHLGKVVLQLGQVLLAQVACEVLIVATLVLSTTLPRFMDSNVSLAL